MSSQRLGWVASGYDVGYRPALTRGPSACSPRPCRTTSSSGPCRAADVPRTWGRAAENRPPCRSRGPPIVARVEGGTTMRFMMLMIPHGYEKAEPGAMPSAEMVAEMTKYNEALTKAGVLLALDGLHPPSMGTRVSFSRGKPRV